jgi:hypothetical protein
MTHRIMQSICNVMVKEMEYENELGDNLSNFFPKVNIYYHK